MDQQRWIKEAAAKIAELENALEEARHTIDRIKGMCGGDNPISICKCGRPTGIPAIVVCADKWLSAHPAQQEEK